MLGGYVAIAVCVANTKTEAVPALGLEPGTVWNNSSLMSDIVIVT